MRVGLLVNQVRFQLPHFTTAYLVNEAQRRGHECFIFECEAFAHDQPIATRVPRNQTFSNTELLNALRETTSVSPSEMDLLFLRFNPFGQYFNSPLDLILNRLKQLSESVLCINSPHGLAKARDKRYLLEFPEHLRPECLLSPSQEEAAQFIAKGPAVLKPICGFGGRGIELIESSEMIQSVKAPFLLEEYIQSTPQSDIRVLLIDGRPIRIDGKLCAFRRVSPLGDFRSNMQLGATREPVELTSDQLELFDEIQPKLLQDGLRIVGADIIGNKIIELNVFCPGGIRHVDEIYDVNTSSEILAYFESN